VGHRENWARVLPLVPPIDTTERLPQRPPHHGGANGHRSAFAWQHARGGEQDAIWRAIAAATASPIICGMALLLNGLARRAARLRAAVGEIAMVTDFMTWSAIG
jgi:hypothetical protein